MQGQRGIIGSLPEILEFDHGFTSGNAIIDPHICWNIMSNPAENRLADFTISPSHLNNAHINPIDQERQNLSGWSLGEPSSSSAPNQPSLEEKKPEHSLSVGAGPRLEEREHEQPGILSLVSAKTSSQSAQSSNSYAIPQNLDLNAGFDGHGGDLGSTKSKNDRKGKAEEGNVGQSSTSESPGFLQCSVNTAWSSPPAGYNAESSLSIAAPLEQLNPRLGLGLRGLASDSSPDSSQRNFRLRINPSNQDSSPQSLLPSANAVRRSNVSSSRHSSRVPPADYSLDFRSLPVLEDAASLSQPLPVPSLPQNVQPFGWNEIESSSSRNGSSSSSITLGNREEGNMRNLWEHPIFVPATELRTSVRNPSNRTVGSTSRAGSSPGGNPLSAPTWAAHPSPSSRSPRRLAECVRRSLFSSANGESGGRSSNSPPHSGPAEAVVSSGGPSRGHHRSYRRSGSRGERQVDGVLGFPDPLRNLAAGEGRSRLLVSEIRCVLDLMRRGENLQFEDVMILDQSALFGVPDIHDRRRDMRLDVDNMSYEELLALEERIGNVSTGLSEETISKQLKQRQYSATEKSDVEAEPCCVCQEEYGEGENIGTLDCGHDFHSECIKQWLMLKNWCPICKTTGLAT